MKAYTINEENHGFIGVAASHKAALQWLVTLGWVDQYSEIWCLDESKRWGGYNKMLGALYGENWKEEFLQFSKDQLENMGFYIREEELIGEEN